MDDPSLALALQLQREDLDAPASLLSADGARGENDESVAIQVYRVEIERVEREFLDHGLARRLGEGDQAEPAPQQSSIVNNTRTTIQPIDVDRIPTPKPPNLGTQSNPVIIQEGAVLLPEPELASNCKGKRKQGEDLSDAERPSKKVHVATELDLSPPAKPRPPPTGKASSSKSQAAEEQPIVKQDCAACHDEKHNFDVVDVSCGHHYCRDCAVSMFKTAMADESLFPPRCCGKAVPIEVVKSFFMTPALAKEFEAKAIEFSTPDRTYCSVPSCALFIPPKQIKIDVATCTCKHETCTMCKGNTHAGNLCPRDKVTNEVLDMGKKNGWQRCYKCSHMVEITTGCNHMK